MRRLKAKFVRIRGVSTFKFYVETQIDFVSREARATERSYYYRSEHFLTQPDSNKEIILVDKGDGNGVSECLGSNL
jgi:hypothetical protein